MLKKRKYNVLNDNYKFSNKQKYITEKYMIEKLDIIESYLINNTNQNDEIIKKLKKIENKYNIYESLENLKIYKDTRDYNDGSISKTAINQVDGLPIKKIKQENCSYIS